MDLPLVFQACNWLALCGWFLLIAFMHLRVVRESICPVVLPGIFALIYILLVATRDGLPDFGSLNAVEGLFEDRGWLLAGWIHYLAFDLMVGSWMARDALALGISRLATTPCLVLTFLAGPAGWFCYAMLRIGTRRRVSVGTAQ